MKYLFGAATVIAYIVSITASDKDTRAEARFYALFFMICILGERLP